MDFPAFRSHGHALVDWVADYLERLDQEPILPNVLPGEVRAKLPAMAPEGPESFDTVMRDFESIVYPGMTHWGHPRFFAYFPANQVRRLGLGGQLVIADDRAASPAQCGAGSRRPRRKRSIVTLKRNVHTCRAGCEGGSPVRRSRSFARRASPTRRFRLADRYPVAGPAARRSGVSTRASRQPRPTSPCCARFRGACGGRTGSNASTPRSGGGPRSLGAIPDRASPLLLITTVAIDVAAIWSDRPHSTWDWGARRRRRLTVRLRNFLGFAKN